MIVITVTFMLGGLLWTLVEYIARRFLGHHPKTTPNPFALMNTRDITASATISLRHGKKLRSQPARLLSSGRPAFPSRVPYKLAMCWLFEHDDAGRQRGVAKRFAARPHPN